MRNDPDMFEEFSLPLGERFQARNPTLALHVMSCNGKAKMNYDIRWLAECRHPSSISG
jgi:hypothetical protein